MFVLGTYSLASRALLNTGKKLNNARVNHLKIMKKALRAAQNILPAHMRSVCLRPLY